MGFKNYIFKEYDGMEHTNTEQVRASLIYSFISKNIRVNSIDAHAKDRERKKKNQHGIKIQIVVFLVKPFYWNPTSASGLFVISSFSLSRAQEIVLDAFKTKLLT